MADNLRLARSDASDADLLAVLVSFDLRSQLDELPDGIATSVDGHRHISDGERQLIALGQVVLLDPSVVILEESTSALDPAAPGRSPGTPSSSSTTGSPVPRPATRSSFLRAGE